MSDYAEEMQQELVNFSIPQKAEWLESYVKHGIKSRGVSIPKIREILINIVKESSLNLQSYNEQLKFINCLMGNIYTEDKLAAILYTQLYWRETDPNFQLSTFSDWFDRGLIFDWNVCDWLCVRVLNRLIDMHSKISIKEMEIWNKSNYLWKARASLVAFVYTKPLQKHGKVISEFSTNLIQREERFCKTAVGWILREYSKIDQKFVIAFVEKNIDHFTRETIQNSFKYFKNSLRKDFLVRIRNQ